MTKLLALILACLALGLVAAGCGDDDDDGGSDATTTEQPAAGGGGGTQVSMENIQFTPRELTVKAGETVTFTNNESTPHDVHKTSGPGADFSSGDVGGMQEGDTFDVTLGEPGKYEYVCELHEPGMAGSITVK